MRMHTAAHILSAIINQQTKALITGNELGLDKSRIDFDLEKFDREQMHKFIEIANQAIAKGGEVTTYTISRQEAKSRESLQTRKGYSSNNTRNKNYKNWEYR